MQDFEDDEHYIPIAICGNCGKESPLNYRGTFTKKGFENIEIWATSCCDIVPCDESVIKGYISIKELEGMGFVKEVG